MELLLYELSTKPHHDIDTTSMERHLNLIRLVRWRHEDVRMTARGGWSNVIDNFQFSV